MSGWMNESRNRFWWWSHYAGEDRTTNLSESNFCVDKSVEFYGLCHRNSLILRYFSKANSSFFGHLIQTKYIGKTSWIVHRRHQHSYRHLLVASRGKIGKQTHSLDRQLWLITLILVREPKFVPQTLDVFSLQTDVNLRYMWQSYDWHRWI